MDIPESSYDFIKVIMSEPKPKINEKLFVSVYLPLLFNEDPLAFNLKWINDVAMNPYLEVEVVDDNNKVLYLVPPLRSPLKTSLKRDIPNLANYAIMEHRVHKLRAEMVLAENLPKLIQFETGITDENERRWQEIIIRNGYGDRLINTKTQPNSSVQPVEDIQLSDDEDDW